MFDYEILRSKEKALLEIIHPNVLLLALLTEHDLLDLCTEQKIRAKQTDFDRNRCLLDWLKQSPQEAIDGFLRALRANGQCHVANYIDGTPGEDLPLCEESRKRLRRIRGRVSQIMNTNSKLLAYLYQERVIGETDYHYLRSESEMTNRNLMLMDIILRGSARGFASFCECLHSDVNQAYLVPCLQRGEILTMHVKTQPAEKDAGIVTMLKKVMSMKDAFEELSNEEIRDINELLRQLQADLVGARVGGSVLLFTHLMTTGVLESVHGLFNSGQLTAIIRDIFRPLAKDENLTVEVDISADQFKECEDGFADDGSFCISMQKPTSPVQSESEELQRLRKELRQMDELDTQCRRHEANFISIGDCLSVIEKDSAINDASNEALQKAQECVRDSMNLKTGVYKLLNVGHWLNTSDFMDIVDSPVYLRVDAENRHVATDAGDDILSVDTGFCSDLTSSTTRYAAEKSTERYAMTSSKRGIFVIISNEHFQPQTQFQPRPGAQHDRDTLTQLFVRLGFDVRVHQNVTANKACQILARAGEMDHRLYDCFAVAVMTHGYEGNAFVGVDGESFTLTDLMTPIRRCQTLAGKPKICIIQASRGSLIDDGIEIEAGSDGRKVNIPLDADQLLVHSTSEGHFSWRSSAKGSWFINALSDELTKALSSSSDDVNLSQVLTRAAHTVAYEYQSSALLPDMNAKKQVPSLYSTLTKEIHFPCLTSA